MLAWLDCLRQDNGKSISHLIANSRYLCLFVHGEKSLTSEISLQASFLRKINRSGQRDSNETLSEHVDGTEASSSPETQQQHYARSHGRAGSEPTEQLLSSIPLHLRSHHRPPQSPPRFRRNVSDANSHLPGALERPFLLHHESDEHSDLVESRGLSVLYSPSEADLDLVFIHGLGGSSLKTWSFARQTENFWPLWLSQDPEFVATRILTFGYNADFRGPSTILNITDFAKDLVSRMLTFEEETTDGSKIRMGQVRRSALNVSTIRCPVDVTLSARYYSLSILWVGW